MDPEVNERFESIDARLDKLVDAVTTLAQVASSHQERLDRLEADQAETARQMRETTEQMKHTDERLGILIKMMDEWIRDDPRDGRA